MEIKDYITKNLPNLNWNILPQIFEENDVELTEEIKAYLRNTPENTNWNLLKKYFNKKTPIIKKAFVTYENNNYILNTQVSDFNSAEEVYNYCIENYVALDEHNGTIANFEIHFQGHQYYPSQSFDSSTVFLHNNSTDAFAWTYQGSLRYYIYPNRFAVSPID